MKGKHKLILAVSIIVIAIVMCWSALHIRKVVQRMRYYSAISWLNVAVRESLDNYYDTHGNYPPKLQDLDIPFPGDNAEPQMLSEFAYSTDGTYYELSCEVLYGDKLYTYREYAVEGGLTFSEFYINGQLDFRHEFED